MSKTMKDSHLNAGSGLAANLMQLAEKPNSIALVQESVDLQRQLRDLLSIIAARELGHNPGMVI